MIESRRLGWLGGVILLTLAADAFAQAQPSPENKVLAESLFRDGKQLMAEKKFEQACRMLAESQRLDPGGGTLLNLAACHEGQGKTASAWSDYQEALSTAKRDGREDRIRAATARIHALEPTLSTLSIVATAGDGLEVRVDGSVLPSVALGRPTPIDPGKHHVSASAPAHKPFDADVDVGPNGDKKVVTVPSLEAAPPTVSAGLPPPTATPVTTPPPAPKEEPSHGDSRATRRLIGIVVGGVGLAAVGVGSAFGAMAIDKKSQSDADCGSAPPYRGTAAGAAANDDARTFGNLSTALVVGGLVFAGAGAVLFLTALGGSEHKVAISPAPGGVWVSGSF
jgi:hypothetical protein